MNKSRIFFAFHPYLAYCIFVLALFVCCNSKTGAGLPPVVPPEIPVNEIDFWLTRPDGAVKLQKQPAVLAFSKLANQYAEILVDEAVSFQAVDGFGFTLTGGSAELINSLDAAKKQELLQELFGSGENGISVSYLRLSIGASDLNSSPFSYDDLPAGAADPGLLKFNLAEDTINLIPLLKEILAINPGIKLLATPWSPPTWMKDNNSFIGGSLQKQFYRAYAQYFVKYIKGMAAQGIPIDAITPQNEPLNPANNPSMLMLAADEAEFIRDHLGPAFQAAHITAKIIIYDHNCDRPDYPLSILNDAAAKAFVNGVAFHLYAGDISALSTVRNAHPDKAIYFTEQYTASTGNFGGDLKWHVKNVVIGSMRNYSRNALEWNLANNSAFGPHTAGGCDACKGAVTIETSSSYTRNVAYYVIAHASKFVPAGSVRISSSTVGDLNNVAFKTPAGKKVLIVENDGAAPKLFNIRYNGKWAVVSLEAGCIGTFVW
jgi:glucosylceramidase